MPRKKKTDKISTEIMKDLLDRPFELEVDPPKTLWEALQLMQHLSDNINGYLEKSPLVQDYALLHANRVNKTQGYFRLAFTPEIDFVGEGRTKKRTTTKAQTPKAKPTTPKATPKKVEKPKEETPKTELELLWERAKELKLDISDVKDNPKAISDRISLVEDMVLDPMEEEPSQEEEIIIINPNRKKRKPKIRTQSIASINQGTRSLSGLGNILGTIQEKSLESISEYISNKDGLEDEPK